MGSCGPCGADNLPNPLGGPASGLSNAGNAGGFQAGPLGVAVGGAITPGGGIGPVPRTPLGPAAVNLRTAGNFKILAKSGITNVPTSQVIGDMGVSPIAAASITGFALVLDGGGQFSKSAQVTGKVYAADYAPPTPALLTQAVIDMEAAYTDASGRPADFTDLAAGNLGGLTLVPGTYKFNSNVSVAIPMTFLGGPDDTWIIQVAGTLNVAPGVSIILAGGAQAKNIIWVVAGATTIGGSGAFNGTILDQTSITIQTGTTVNGQLLAQTAVALDKDIIDP